jgi:hypothetical protein
MRRALLPAWLAILTTLGLLAGGANAATFCVNEPICVGTDHPTIQAALLAAEANGVEDTVFVGANGGTPYVESPSYTDAAEIVHIVGDGVDQTIIEGTGSPSNAVTLLGQGSSIQDLTIRIPNVSNGAALRWDGAIASDIRATHTGSTATEINGMVAEGNATLEDSTVDVNGFGLFTIQSNANDVEISDSTLLGDGRGISVGDGTLTLRRSTVASARSPIAAGNGGDFTVENAILRQTGSIAADGAVYMLSGSEGIVRHATILGADTGRGALIDSTSGDTKLTIFDSIIDGFATSLLCSGTAPNTATLGISYSSWTEPTQTEDADCADTFGGINDNVNDPVFVSTNPLTLNFRLKAPSPLIDAGDPADPLTVDLTGAPREVDGDGVGGARSDMGAYEYQRQPPAATINAPTSATIGEAADFSAAGSSDPDPGDTLTFSWDFGDGTVAEGFAPQHTFSKAGTFPVELTVTDPTGLSDSATAQIEVPAVAGGPKGKAKPKKPKKPKAGVAITDLRAVPKRIRRGKGLPKLVKGLKRPGFQFNLSKASDVTLTLVRCKGKRGCRKRARIKGSATFKAAKGSSTIRFRGRLTGKKLRKGRYRATLRAGTASAAVGFRLI